MKKFYSPKLILLSAFLLIANFSFSQTTFPVNGVHDEKSELYALTHATVFTDYKTVITDATIIVRKGLIENIGQNISIPQGAVVVDCKGKFIYPSFIDLYSDYGMPKTEQKNNPPGEQYLSSKPGAYGWNEAIHAEISAQQNFSVDENRANDLRKLGFGSVVSHSEDGIMRGTGAFVMLSDKNSNEVFVNPNAANFLSFNKGTSTQDYPSSLMGSIALLRQNYYDALWYKNSKPDEYNISLDAINKNFSLPDIFMTNDVLSDLRADKVGDEFGLQYIIYGNGDEYQRLNEIKNTNAQFILPLNFPCAYDVTDPYDAVNIQLSDMWSWELAPTNPAVLDKAGINFCFTLDGLKDESDFFKNIRKAISYGLSPQDALKALTYNPAMMMNSIDKTGTLANGKLANFIICNDTLFKENTVIIQNWVDGKPFIENSLNFADVRGEYNLYYMKDMHVSMSVFGDANTPKAKVKITDSLQLKAEVSITDNLITLTFHYPADTSSTMYRLSGIMDGSTWSGSGQRPDGSWTNWSAQKVSDFKSEKEKNEIIDLNSLAKIHYPFTGFGWTEQPKQDTIFFQNATVWTNEDTAVLKNTNVQIANGKIVAVGKNISALPHSKIIDCTGKHLTSGIIDEHSHIAISEGANEGTQSVTSEVRIGDVVTSEDINIYRQLAGGVTCSHLLHGSANGIGGQTQLVKLRWGFSPEEMKFTPWPGFIKFALGENVKQSNWGDNATTRFPQTRMGVEQNLYDAFWRAKDYKLKWENYDSWMHAPVKQHFKMTPVEIPRRDLELDALVEILDGKRFITCHSYQQGEINMLMHVADSMHFQMNTFTHILEGFKVADKMQQHGVFASSFADWWTYKYEVVYAIPYNMKLLSSVGVITAINSDDAEMGRRLNQEAAKGIKYGGMSEIEAWKMCTLNPAKMLHVADFVGSIKVGKDADLVLWNDNPLSIYAKPLMTFVDGREMFSVEKDSLSQIFIQQERTRLINKMLEAKQNGDPTQPVQLKFQMEYDCDTMTNGSKVGVK